MTRERSSDATPVMIRRPMNDHGTMTVEVDESNETRHLVEYESTELQQTLAALPTDTRVPIRMVPISARANVWRAVGFRSEPQQANVEARSVTT